MNLNLNQIATLTEFLESGGLQLDFFDIGRRVNAIPREQFLAFEQTEAPYPMPLQQQAWFALTFSDPTNQAIDPMIWFIRFPLDEQAKLLQAARDDFMHRLVEKLGNRAEVAQSSGDMQKAVQDNPYLFQPKEERLAVFHARLTAFHGKPASRYYKHAKAYFNGELGWDQWSFLGYQGIADLSARMNQDGSSEKVASSITELPPAPLEALCHCLENETIPKTLTLALGKRAQATLKQSEPNLQILTAVIRGISQSTSINDRNKLINKILNHPFSWRSDILIAIAGRAWECLEDESLSRIYLERLANNELGQDFFNNILSDLLYLPDTRSTLQARLRDPQRSEKLSQFIGRFFANVKQGSC
jgi:hypothetical protein